MTNRFLAFLRQKEKKNHESNSKFHDRSLAVSKKQNKILQVDEKAYRKTWYEHSSDKIIIYQ